MVYLLIGILAGAILPIQAAINSELSRLLGHPLLSSFLSFIIGTLTLFLILFFLSLKFMNPGIAAGSERPLLSLFWQQSSSFARMPLYVFLGGPMGVIYVTISLFLVKNIGTLKLTMFVFMGQCLGGLLIDSFGLFNLPVRPLNFSKIMGVIFFVIGFFLVKKN